MSDTLRLDLDVVLPHAHDRRDKCVADLVASLSHVDGVESVHITNTDAPQICLHLQKGAVSIPRLTDRVRATGAGIGERYGHLLVQGPPPGYASRARTRTAQLRALPGVIDGAVSIEGLVRVEYDPTATSESQILDALGLGTPTVGSTPDRMAGPDGAAPEVGHDHREDTHHRHRGHDHGASHVELVAAFIALAVYVVARMLDWFTDLDTTVLVMYIVAAFTTGVFVAQDAWRSVRARVFDIDQLMIVAAIGASAIGHWSDSALLLVLFSLGHALEGYAMGRARHAIEALGELAPATARRRGQPDVEVPLDQIQVGDVVVVRPHARVPVDGVVVAGRGSVDESAVTGESLPVDKVAAPVTNGGTAAAEWTTVVAAHRVFAGTLNGAGALEVEVSRPARDSTLARVVQMVAEAETQISPSQRLTARIVRVFVPGVLVLVAGCLVIPPLLGEAFTASFARAMAVLVAASPCALAIATPSAVLSAIARAARSGILVKGGGPLESLGSVRTIAFDKTGTLTVGRPTLTDVVAADGVASEELLRVAWAVEARSDHPLARAVVEGARRRLPGHRVDDASDVIAVTGAGVAGTVNGARVMVGNVTMFGSVRLPEPIAASVGKLQDRGRTTMIVCQGDRFLGVIGVMDEPRAEASVALAQLRSLGVDTMVMLSGDNPRVARAVGAELGIADVRGALMPADKVAAVNELAIHGGVAMVGDGVNDAPALAAANVGIAMGAAGSDVALETADIALMADRLDRLPLAVGLARRASSTIKQNLFFSLGVVVVLVPLTLLGVGISAAVIAHEGSTVIVVLNALRLLQFPLHDDHVNPSI